VTHSPQPSPRPKFLSVLAGTTLFFVLQYAVAIIKLTHSSGGMENKFSALARNEYIGFLVLQNLQMLIAYAILAGLAALLVQPFVGFWGARNRHKSFFAVAIRSFVLTLVVHAFFTLRLADTRPYFLNEAEFGQWYYRALDLIPVAIKPACLLALFSILPLAVAAIAVTWHLRHNGRKAWWLTAAAAIAIAAFYALPLLHQPATLSVRNAQQSPNVIIIGSDSLRADRLGCAGYVPGRSDGPASSGVSPVIDALAKNSTRFENCYTSIASTMESGTQLMSSQYPQSHGIRQMYPNKATVAATTARIVPIARLLREKGYNTTAIGDWCAGYYEVLPLDFEHIAVSSFDNFKIYMSQAVVMAHFVVPLYFDNEIGYRIFPQLGAFAQFVTPEVVTARVEKRLADVAKNRQPFFWHVFYSCNHLPYRSRESFRSLFSDPNYQGRNRNGVDFDIDSFIGSTDLESKWKALPPKEIAQIRALYDGCTRQFDQCVGQILASLKANGLDENTIVIVTSDHGDDHYEPNVTLGHGLTFNGGLQANHIPMIVHVPGAKPQVIAETIRLIDVIPSMADFIGLTKSPTWQGQSFAGWIQQTEKPIERPFYAETGFPFIQFKVAGVERPKLPAMDELTGIDKNFNYQFVLKPQYIQPLIDAKQRCLKTQFWKIVCTPTAKGDRHFGLFHLASDPNCEHDLATNRSEILSPLQQAIERWIDQKLESSIHEIFPNGEPQ
jgi:arylsulfatase A-like enzyme